MHGGARWSARCMEVQEVLGGAHPNSTSAMQLLMNAISKWLSPGGAGRCAPLCTSESGLDWRCTGVQRCVLHIWGAGRCTPPHTRTHLCSSRDGTLKFDGWPWKTKGHLFYATSSFVQHFVAIGEFKLELQSGNTQSGSNLTFLRAVWPWNLTDDLQKQ